MGFFSKIGKAVGKVAKGVGKAVSTVGRVAAPIVGLVPGVGTLAAAGIGAGSQLLGGALQGKVKLNDILRTGASGALGGLAGGALRGAGGISGLVSRAGSLAGGAQRLLGGGGGGEDDPYAGMDPEQAAQWRQYDQERGAYDAAGGASGGGGRTSLTSLLGQAGRFALDNPGIISAGAGMISGAGSAGRADRLRNQAANLAEPQRESLDDLYANSGNPYTPRRRGTARRAALSSLTSGY